MIRDQFNFAMKGIIHRKVRSWLTMIGIFIGIVAIVSLIGLGEGLRVAISSQFGFVGSDILTIQASGLTLAGPPGFGTVTPLTDDLIDKIEKVNGVEAVIPRYMESCTLEFKGEQRTSLAMSIPRGDQRRITYNMLNLETEQGRLLRDGDIKKVMLGNNFKDEATFGIKAGDRVLISDVQFEVIGIIEKKGNFLFDNIVVIEEEDMFNFLDTNKEKVSLIIVKVRNVDKISSVKEDVEKLLRKERDVKTGEEDFSVESAEATLDTLNSSLFAVQLFVYLIASISLLVGGIGIMNTMYTSVLERTKEIGIMKSIGATNTTIFTLFFIESGLLGLVGGIIGVVFGIFLAMGAAAVGRAALGIDFIQATISPGLIIGALSFSIIVGLIAGIFPARQASKKHPVDALRFVK